MGKKSSKVSTMCCGIAGVILVAGLTGFSVNAVLDKINDNADKAYAEALSNVQNAKLAEWQAEQDRLAALEESEIVIQPITITDYTVDDIIMIDGQMYVISSNTSSSPDIEDSNDTSTDESTESVDSSEIIENDSESPNEESSNDTQTPVEVDPVDDVPYIGAEYVTIDIDGNMVYHVNEGDTLTKISNLTGYSVQEIAEYNCIENVNLIYTGQSIRIPASQAAIDYVAGLQADSAPTVSLEAVPGT